MSAATIPPNTAFYWRLAAAAYGFNSLVVLALNLAIVRTLPLQGNWEDVQLVGAPMLCIFTGVATSLTVAAAPDHPGPLQSCLRGAFIGANLFLLWLGAVVGGSFAALHEGMRYWVSVELPSIWLGLPLIIVGALVGAKSGGARIPLPLLAVAAAVLFWVPLTILGEYMLTLARQLFVLVFAW